MRPTRRNKMSGGRLRDEAKIAAVVERKKALPLDSIERQLINRILTGLRYSYEEAGGIIEDLDPFGRGATCRRLATSPSTEPGQVLPFRKRSQQKQDSEELKEREQRKLDPRRQDLVQRIVAAHPETKWGDLNRKTKKRSARSLPPR